MAALVLALVGVEIAVVLADIVANLAGMLLVGRLLVDLQEYIEPLPAELGAAASLVAATVAPQIVVAS